MVTNAYERQQLMEIEKWEKEEPGVVSKVFETVAQPLAWAVQKVVPEAAIRGALDFSNAAGEFLADKTDILRDAKIDRIEELQGKDLKESDQLANEVHNWAIGIAAAEGGAEGAAGLPGMVAGMPVLITLALRTIHKIGLCYGYESKNEEDRKFVLGIMMAAGANSISEKNEALLLLKSIEQTIIKKTFKKMANDAMKNKISADAIILSIKALAKQLGINLTKRKMLAVLPVFSALIGASANGWFLKEVGWAARRGFQRRWLNDKSYDIEAEVVAE